MPASKKSRQLLAAGGIFTVFLAYREGFKSSAGPPLRLISIQGNLLSRTVASGFRIFVCGVGAIHGTLSADLRVTQLVLIMGFGCLLVVLCSCFMIAGSLFVQSAGFVGIGHSVFPNLKK